MKKLVITLIVFVGILGGVLVATSTEKSTVTECEVTYLGGRPILEVNYK